MPQWSNDLRSLSKSIASGKKARVHYPHPTHGFPDDYEHYLEGNFTESPDGDHTFHPTDEVHQGISHRELTDSAPDTGPQDLSHMLGHGAHVELMD